MSENNGHEKERYELEEMIDDVAVEGQFTNEMLNAYIYEFKQGGQVIRGLTAAAIAHIALEQNISIVEVEETSLNEGVLYKSTAEKLDTGQRAFGVAYAPFVVNGRPDPFCWQKAMTKSARNARKQLIPATMMIQAVDQLQALPKVAAGALPTPEAKEDAERENARKAMFATFGEKKVELEKMGITEDLFREAMLKEYGVESRADLTTQQYKNCKAALELENFSNWIRDAAPKEQSAEGEGEPKSPF